MYYFFGELNRDIYHISNNAYLCTYSQRWHFWFWIYFHVYYTLDLLCNPNSKYVPMYFQKISQFSFHSVIDVHILRAMICSSNYVYDWFYMCSKLFLIGKWYISICLSIIAFKPYVIGFPIIMQYCNALILEVCFERKIIQVSQKLLNM